MIKKYIQKIVRGMLSEGFWNDCVFCDECGVVVRKNKAYTVLIKDLFAYRRENDDYNWAVNCYCDRHKKNYNREERYSKDIIYYKDNVEVDKNGKIIK